MTWTYVPDFTTDRDKMRREIGDTDTTDQLLSDEELAYFLAEEGNYLRGAAAACEALAAAASREPDFAVGGKIIQKSSQKAGMYLDAAVKLRKKARRSVAPYAGGISIADKLTLVENDDAVQPFFSRDGEDEYGTEPVDQLPNPAYPPLT